MKRLQTIFAVLVVVLALANAKQTNNKQAVIQMELVPHQKIDLSAAELRSKYCYGEVDYDLPPECFTFDADCGFCYSQDFIYECLYNCGNGDCAGNANVCPGGFMDYCTANFIVCSQCFQRYELCSCPSGMTMNIFANQSRICSLVPCPTGQFRVDPNCSICQDCDEGCSECENTGDNCFTCQAPYCWVEGNKCVDPNTAVCPEGLFKLMTDDCFECNPICPVGMYANSETGRCENCADGCSQCSSFEICDICEPYEWNNYCMYQNTCVQFCPSNMLMLFHDPNDPNQCFDCVPCDGCPGESFCDYDNFICSTDCQYPNFIFEKNCITTCPAGLYLTPDPVTGNPTCVFCSFCPSNSVCNDETNECQVCNPPSVIDQGKCLDVCPDGYFSRPAYDNNDILICVGCDSCPFGTFCDQETHQCNTCSDTCQQCIGSSDKCMPPCPQGKVWYQFSCIDECPSDTYLFSQNDYNNIGCVLGQDCYCGNCPAQCSSCVGGGINDCTGCYPPYKLTTAGTCVDPCPEGTYDQEGVCQCCNKLCTSCTGPTSAECNSCVEGSLLDGTTCMEAWDVQAYLNAQMGM